MTVALLTLNAISLATIAVTVFYGNAIPQGGGMLGRHLMMALIAILLAVFTHTMTLFYFIGVGSSIRNAVRETGVGAGELDQSRKLKSRVFPWTAAAALALMVAFILGGAAHTRALPSWVHGSLAYLALALNAAALVVEARYLFRQNRVVYELQQRLLLQSKSHSQVT
jgi:hypothetical protein